VPVARLPSKWVERMIGKHQHLPTDKLVLIAKSGFRPQAREAAKAAGVATFAPEDLEADDPSFQVISQLQSLWPKFISFFPDGVRIWVDEPGQGMRAFAAPPDLLLFLPSGTEICALHEAIGGYLNENLPRFAEEMRLEDVTEDTQRASLIDIGPQWMVEVAGALHGLQVREQETGDLRPIAKVEILGTFQIRVSDVSLEQHRLGEVVYAFGEGKVGAEDALLVLTEGEQAKMTVKFRSDPALNLRFESL
jgi:hypothetical protein